MLVPPYYSRSWICVDRSTSKIFNNIPMIVTHKHCARVLMKYLLNMNDEDFETYTIPNDIIELTMKRDFTLKSHKFIDY